MLMRDIPGMGFFFFIFYKYKVLLSGTDDDHKHTPFIRQLSGGLSGLTAFACFYPTDVMKSHI